MFTYPAVIVYGMAGEQGRKEGELVADRNGHWGVFGGRGRGGWELRQVEHGAIVGVDGPKP